MAKRPYNGILVNTTRTRKKEQTLDICNKVDEHQKPYVEQRKPDTKVYIPYDSIYMKTEGNFSDRS